MDTKLAGFIDGVTSWTGAVAAADTVKDGSPIPQSIYGRSSRPTAEVHEFRPLTCGDVEPRSEPPTERALPVGRYLAHRLLARRVCGMGRDEKVQGGPLHCLVDKVLQAENVPRNYLLTVLRMLANAFSNRVLAREVILFAREAVSKLLVDAALRAVAASLGFNVRVRAQIEGRQGQGARTGGVSGVVVAAVVVHGAGGVVVEDVAGSGGVEGEAGKGGLLGGWGWGWGWKGGAEVDHLWRWRTGSALRSAWWCIVCSFSIVHDKAGCDNSKSIILIHCLSPATQYPTAG